MKTLRILIAVAAAAMTLTAATAQQTEPKIIIVKGGGSADATAAEAQRMAPDALVIQNCSGEAPAPQSQKFLCIVDGKAIDDLSTIDAGSIESMTILKDPDALREYEHLGDTSNGVVVIELKDRQADEVYDNVEQMPTFLGGNIETFRQWLMQQIRYPAEAIEAGIGGTVLIKFIIGTDGSIEPSTLEIMRSPHEILSSEVIRVMKLSPRWEPGRNDGKAVRTTHMVPVSFRTSASFGTSDGKTTAGPTTVVKKNSAEEIVVIGFKD